MTEQQQTTIRRFAEFARDLHLSGAVPVIVIGISTDTEKAIYGQTVILNAQGRSALEVLSFLREAVSAMEGQLS